MLNKEICFLCCCRMTVVANDVEKKFDFKKSFEVGWKNNLSFCPCMAGWINPLNEIIPSKCPYIVEHLVNVK